MRRAWLLFGLSCAALACAYLPLGSAGWVWDDAGHLTRPELRGLGGLARIWSEPSATQQYYPLLHTLFWIEDALWGPRPLYYHLVNLALHALVATGVWQLARRLAIPGAWAIALVFALHPVQVESVAWVSEQKNTLSGAFYFAAWLVWSRFDDGLAHGERRWGAWAGSLVLALAAVLSKSVTLTLAPAILIATWWREGGTSWLRRVPWLLPHALLALAAGLVTAWLEVHVGGARGAGYEPLDLAQRCIVAGKNLWFYLGRLAWPAGTCFVYPRWHVGPIAAWEWALPLGFVALLAASFVARARLGRGPCAALAFFALTLAPALGFFDAIPFRYSFVADHFQYLACLGPLALAAGASARWRGPAARVALASIALLLAGLSFLHARDFRDEETLWRATLRCNPSAWMAAQNLAVLLNQQGRHGEALAVTAPALEREPRRAGLWLQSGIALQESGRAPEALDALEHALVLEPQSVRAHTLRGNALLALGRSEEALEAYQRALALDQGDGDTWYNLGVALLQRRDYARAAEAYERALACEPGNLSAQLNRAIAWTHTGRSGEARAELERLAREPGETVIAQRASQALRLLDAGR